jgi:hypothetical protein
MKLSGLELKDIVVQQDLIVIEKAHTNIPESSIYIRSFILKEIKCEH